MSKEFFALNLLIRLCENKKVSFSMEGNTTTLFIYAGPHSYVIDGYVNEENLIRACVHLGALLGVE